MRLEETRPLRRVGYRLAQGLRALRERPTPESDRLVSRLLDGEGMALFTALSPRDQFHSARTASILMASGVEDPVLLKAALLHDVGKGRQVLWQRAVYVLLSACAPRLLRRLACAGGGWRGALDRSLRHASLGAEAARHAGYPTRIVELIAHHHDTPSGTDLAALQAADERA
jgi:putative nucleotidyltransferase with HDIG domain